MMNQDPTAAPSAVLREEHQVILRVLNVLQRLVERAEAERGFEIEAFRKCVEFFRFFADACHHAKEEDLLFPVLESRGIPKDNGPIGVMLYEHTIARGLTRQMGEAVESAASGDAAAAAGFCATAREYIDLLSRHIQKEDNILFTMGDQVMQDADQKTLCAQFCEMGCRSFGGKKREELAQLASELEAEWSDA